MPRLREPPRPDFFGGAEALAVARCLTAVYDLPAVRCFTEEERPAVRGLVGEVSFAVAECLAGARWRRDSAR
jgi:hypothetical protein